MHQQLQDIALATTLYNVLANIEQVFYANTLPNTLANILANTLESLLANTLANILANHQQIHQKLYQQIHQQISQQNAIKYTSNYISKYTSNVLTNTLANLLANTLESSLTENTYIKMLVMLACYICMSVVSRCLIYDHSSYYQIQYTNRFMLLYQLYLYLFIYQLY